MSGNPARWLSGVAAASLLAAGLSAAATTAARAVGSQSGPSWPGNLLSMDNADFENGAGDWNAVSGAKPLTTDSTAYLHNSALKIVASGTTPPAITSVLQLSGTNGIQITLTPGATYRVGAYVQMPATTGHTTEFDLGCYDSTGKWLGWSNGQPVSNNGSGAWQWVEDDITVPPNSTDPKDSCAYVQGSPRVQFTGMHDGGTIHMDEVWFAPERAALMIGAHAPDPSTWVQDDNSSTGIGPLQSDKIFFGGQGSPALPAQWNDSTNQCYEIEQSIANPAQWPACVINLNPQDSSGDPTVYSESDIQNFFTVKSGGTETGFPANQTVIMVYHGEPEGDSFSGCLTGGTSATNFVCYFEQEATNISEAAAAKQVERTENVFTADDSSSFEYNANGPGMYPYPCQWIVPPGSTDFYLEDHYERGWADGSNLSVQSGQDDPGYNGNGGPQWNNWLNCVKGNDKPIGLAEYGLCSQGADCNKGSSNCDIPGTDEPGGSTTDDTNTLNADNSYLATEPPDTPPTAPTVLWEYWYANCWQFTDSGGIGKWQSIENQNGGAVGG